MKTQQQAEKEEQQRIKNLVLNYDLRENEEQDGEDQRLPLIPDLYIHNHSGYDRPTAQFHHNRMDRDKNRGSQRSRKLQLSDVDWYDSSTQRGEQFGSEVDGSARERNIKGTPDQPAVKPRADSHFGRRSMHAPGTLGYRECRRAIDRKSRITRSTEG